MDALKNLLERIELLEAEKDRLSRRVADLDDFVENAPLPLRWVSASGTIIWANQAELDMLGYTKEEYIGSSMNNHHADSKAYEKILALLKSDGSVQNFAASLRRKDGSVKHVLITSNVVIENGEFVRTRCFTKDISDIYEKDERRKRLLQQLEESEERLRLAVDSTKMGTCDWDMQTGAIHISQEGRKVLGLTPHEKIEVDSLLARLDEADRRTLEQKIQTFINNPSGRHLDINLRFYRVNDNSLRWIRFRGTLYFSFQNNPSRFVASILDITDAKLAKENDARLAAIIQSSNDAIVGKTLEGYVTSWNTAAERMFGYKEEEMVGQSILTIIPEDRKDEEDFILSRLRTGESVEHFETKRVIKSGQLIDVSLRISPIKDSEGNIIGISKIARDITEKKQEEKRKNDFVTMVSHEIKTPMTSILAYAQLLSKHLKTNNDGKGLLMSSKVEAQSKKVINMVQAYLSISRLEEGKLELQKEAFELHPLIAEVIEDAILLGSRHRITYTGCDNVIVQADRNKIGQVLTNLISNAVKYSPLGGDITVQCQKVGSRAKISIRDMGIGISERDQEKLFNRFYRVNNEKARNISGFGIGLYLIAEILRHHNSSIQVDSKEGEGSVFSFELDLIE